MQTKRTIIIFADIQGSTGFGFTQALEKHNEMLRDFHKTCHEAIEEFKRKRGLKADRLIASCRGDECCSFLIGGKEDEDEVLALELAIYLKEKWKVSDFCKKNWQASATGLIPQVDLRIGIGDGDVALDNDIWSGTTTLEGIVISEAKRIEGMADEAKETLIVVKWDIKETCLKAEVPVKFGEAVRLKGKGIPAFHDIPLYPLLTYERWKDIQTEVTPAPKTVDERFVRATALSLSGDFASAIPLLTEVLKTRKNMFEA